MQKYSRLSAFFVLLLIVQLSCGTIAPSTPTENTHTPTLSATPTPTPIPSPAGQIAYGSDRAGIWQIILMELDSGIETSLTLDFEGKYSRPVWSPNGERLAMREDISMDGGGIAVMDVGLAAGRPAGSQPIELFSGFADNPTWSPDGNRIAYISAAGSGGWTAYTVNASGSSPVLIPGIPEHATDLAWSPDGIWIAFSYYTDRSEQIKDLYIVHPDGSGLIRLTNTPNDDEDGPAWSPDSRQIAFSGRDRTETVGERDIFRMNADGTGLTRITSDPASEFDPAWSPDGTQIAFTSTRDEVNDGNYEIYKINIDGTGELRLTNNRSTDRWPTWRATPAGTMPALGTTSGRFIADVTIPAGTRFTGPQEFTKVWRIQNSGDCAWAPAGYALRFSAGDQMGGAGQIPLSGATQPGAAIDLSLRLSAPATPGSYSGEWIIVDGSGRPVPSSDGGTLALAVQIEVMSASTSILPSALYFFSNRSGTNQIWRMETDGATLTQITDESAAVVSYDVSAADGTIAFVSQNKLILANRDGRDRRILVDFGEGSGGSPSWSPDGSLLAYASDGIRLFEPATGTDRLLRPNGSGESMAGIAIYSPREWSPDSTKILATVGYYEGADLAIVSAIDGAVQANGPLTDMFAWRSDSQAVYLASAMYPMMVGMDPGLRLLPAAGDLSPLIENAFGWWPFQRPDDQLAFFISRPAGMDVTEYSAYMSASAADGSGEHALRTQPLVLDTRDSFAAQWVSDGSAAAVWIVRHASGASEVLLIPASDDPPVFLMQQAQDLQWEN